MREGGQQDGCAKAFLGLAFKFQPAAMQFGKSLDQGQAQACPLGMLAGLFVGGVFERFLNADQILWRNPCSVIGHAQGDAGRTAGASTHTRGAEQSG